MKTTKKHSEFIVRLPLRGDLSCRSLARVIKCSIIVFDEIKNLAVRFKVKNNALFLGRGTMHAIAMEGALKLKSNIQEVKSRGSKMIVFEDENSNVEPMDGMEVIHITSNLGRISATFIFTIPLPILSYLVGLIKGTNVDKPRNLAKSVIVECV